VTRTEGPNFSVEERPDRIAVVQVWRRPDLSRDEGARCAQLIADHMKRLAGSARSCIFDLTRATTSWGPATHRAIGEMLRVWEVAGKPLYIVQSDESIQRLLLRELQRKAAPRWGHLVDSFDFAMEALGAGLSGGPLGLAPKRRLP
jgi:hypothetical protein